MNILKDFGATWVESEIRAGERVIGSFPQKFKGGDLFGFKQSAYGIGHAQILFVVVIDGYGQETPVCWKMYGLPEYLVMGNVVYCPTFNDVRNYGDKIYESDARRLVPMLEGLRYE